MIEVAYWFDTSLAMTQKMFVEIAMGPPDTTLPGLTNILPYSNERPSKSGTNITSLVCEPQKIKDLHYINFHRSGFIAFVVLGIIIIFSPVVIIPILQRQRFARSDEARYTRLAWVADGDLQLLRLAHEGKAPRGDWEHADEEIPVPPGQDETCVGELDIKNPKHPVIKAHAMPTTDGAATLALPQQGYSSTSGPPVVVQMNQNYDMQPLRHSIQPLVSKGPSARSSTHAPTYPDDKNTSPGHSIAPSGSTAPSAPGVSDPNSAAIPFHISRRPVSQGSQQDQTQSN
jgi:hypothetical protein